MFELTIKGSVYQFKFGMGFMRKLNRELKQPVDGLKDVEQNIGLQYKIACVMEGDVEALIDILDTANVGFEPRISRDKLDEYIDDENTDIDGLFEKVLDFLRKANATKKVMQKLDKADAEQKAKAAAAN